MSNHQISNYSGALSMASVLKRETALCHKQLEGKLQLLRPPLSQGRFLQVIQRLYGFHVVWEAAVSAHPRLRDHALQRSKIAFIERDLTALNVPRASFAHIERCGQASELARSESMALGSCYVLEGSTLGGQIISKALANQTWTPSGGLETFNPYGAETSGMWSDFIAWLEDNAEEADHDAVIEGACRTFDILSEWLPERPAR